jgi:hypothetical protein
MAMISSTSPESKYVPDPDASTLTHRRRKFIGKYLISGLESLEEERRGIIKEGVYLE